MNDENAQAGYSFVERPSGNSSKKINRLSKDDKSEIEKWISDEVILDKLDVRDIKGGREAAMLSLWILKTKLNKAKAISIPAAFYYLNRKFTTVSVSPEAFTMAISKSKDAEKWFQKNNDNEYFLSTDAQKLVEDWVSGKANIKKEGNQ